MLENQPSPKELLEMPYYEFNNWPKEERSLKIFQHFEANQLYFKDWLLEFKLTIEDILTLNHPEDVLYDFNSKRKHSILIENTIGAEVFSNRKDYIPFLNWTFTKGWTGKEDKIFWNSRSLLFQIGVSDKGENLRIELELVPEKYQLLKLTTEENIEIEKILDKNLSFLDLDLLRLNNERQPEYSTAPISYSICNNWSIKNSSLYYFKFVYCDCSTFYFVDSTMNSLQFQNCIVNPKYYKVKFQFLEFENTFLVDPIFSQIKISSLLYTPYKVYLKAMGYPYEQIINNYKVIKQTQKENDLIDEAANSYYFQKYYDLKMMLEGNWKPEFKKLFTNKTYRKYALKDYLRFSFSLISFLIWGYGIKPIRTIYASLTLISIYSVIYLFSSGCKLHYNFINSIYFSVVTFTTLGFGDITPHSNVLKLVVISEAFLGAFLMGLFVAGYAGKSRY